ncbi:MAG: hypothetical protein SF028_02420 [Candidatus Sumerlaeia bacterium]|nr:hypothetical protein [Candidatus Sumerlaeia bacterium]
MSAGEVVPALAGALPPGTGRYPIETRAALLPSHRQAGEARVRDHLDALARRGYNTVALPVLANGELLVDYDNAMGGVALDCPSASLAQHARQEELSIWLYADLLAAGRPGSDRLGRLARLHPDWLMRGARGQRRAPSESGAPALFCWMTEAFRRLAGERLFASALSIPADAMVIDLRHLPAHRSDPREWTFFGTESLEGIQKELKINIDDLLSTADPDDVAAVEEWRFKALDGFLRRLRARLNTARGDLPIHIAVSPRRSSDGSWHRPWVRWLEDGVAQGVVIAGGAEDAGDLLAEIDADVDHPVPVLAGPAEEDGYLAEPAAWEALPAHGWLALSARPEANPLPKGNPWLRWDRAHCVEAAPLEAASAIVTWLVKGFAEEEEAARFFRELEAYLHVTKLSIGPKQVRQLRTDIAGLRARLESGDIKVPEDHAFLHTAVDRLGRLLTLVPIPQLVY